MEVSDLVLIHNHIQGALDQQNIGDDYDFWSNVPKLKENYLKFFKAHKKRCSQTLANFRIVTVNEDADTSVSVAGMVTNWQRRVPIGRQQLSTVNLELQFLEEHRKQYLDMGAAFASISHSPKSKTCLTNFKNLILLDIKVLMGADLEWAIPAPVTTRKKTNTGRESSTAGVRSSPRRPLTSALSSGGVKDDSSNSDSGPTDVGDGDGAGVEIGNECGAGGSDDDAGTAGGGNDGAARTDDTSILTLDTAGTADNTGTPDTPAGTAGIAGTASNAGTAGTAAIARSASGIGRGRGTTGIVGSTGAAQPAIASNVGGIGRGRGTTGIAGTTSAARAAIASNAGGIGHGSAGGDIIRSEAISAEDFTTWSPANWSSVPWTQVTIPKGSPIYLAATMAFTDPNLQQSQPVFNRSLKQAWDYVPQLVDYTALTEELKPQLTDSQRLWLTGTLAWIKQRKWIQIGSGRPKLKPAGGKRGAREIDTDGLPQAHSRSSSKRSREDAASWCKLFL